MKNDYERLVKENNLLHREVMASTEGKTQTESANYLSLKRKDDELADVRYKLGVLRERNALLEDENGVLQSRVEEVSKMSDKYRDFVEQRVTPLGEGPSGGALGPPVPGAIGSAGEPPLSAVERKTYNLVKAADARLEAVEIELRKSRSLVADLEAEVKLKAEEVQRRDSEIDRLSRAVEENINLDRLALEQRNQEAAAEVDALRRQLESLGQHMKDHEFSQARSREIEAALEASEATRTELEQRLQVAVEENAAIQTELQATTEGLASLQELHAQAGYTPEVPAPLAPAPPAPAAAAAAADAAVKRDVDLAPFQEEKEALLEELSVLRETNDILKQREELITQQAEMQLGQYREAIQAMQQEMEGTNTRLLELQEHVLRMHEAQQGPGGTPEVSERLAQAEQALNALEKALELVSGEKAELHTYLQEMNESRLQISAAYQASEEERKRVEGELTALKAASAGQGHETPIPAAFSTDAAPGASEEATAFKLEIQRLNAKVAQTDALKEELATMRRMLNQAGADKQSLQVHGAEDLQAEIDRLRAALHAAEATRQTEAGGAAATEKSLEQSSMALEELIRERDQALQELHASNGEKEMLLAQLRGFEKQAADIHRTIEGLHVERDGLKADLAAAQEEGMRWQQASREAREDASDSKAHLDQNDLRVASAERQLAAKANEIEVKTEKLNELQEGLQILRQNESEVRAQLNNERMKVQQLSAQLETYQAETGNVEKDLSASHAQVTELVQDLSQARRLANTRSTEVEQLKTLITEMDTTRGELVRKLQESAAQVRGAEAKVAQLELTRGSDHEERAALEKRLQDLKKVLVSADETNDQLQADLEVKDNELARLADENAQNFSSTQTFQKERLALEARLAKAESLLRDSEAEAKALETDRVQSMNQVKNLVAENTAARQEIQALSEDLGQMTREQQVVNSDIVKITVERDSLKGEAKTLRSQLTAAEQLVLAKEREGRELAASYQELGAENRRLESASAQMDREAAERENRLKVQSDELASVRDALITSETEAQQMMTDLQAYERQADSLTRALSGAENKADSGFREREALMEQLRVSKQTVLQLERARSGLQRDLATSEAHAEVMGARMEESSAEVLTLQHKVNLEQGRVKELEGLLASMRAKEHRQEVEGSILGSKSNSLISRNSMLEGQVTSQQQQIIVLEATREAQGREIQRLKTSVLASSNVADGSGAPGESSDIISPLERNLVQRAERAEMALVDSNGLSKQLQSERRDLEARTVGLQADLEKSQKETLSVRQLLEASEASCEEVKGDLAMVQTEVLQLREALHNTSFAREAGEATAGEMAVREQVARAQLKDAEQRITVLEAKLARSGKGEAESSAVLFAAQKELEDLRKDNSRLLELVSTLDAERTDLRTQNAGLEVDMKDMQAQALGAAISAPGTPGPSRTPGRSPGLVGASPARSPTSRGLQEQLQVLRSENDRLKDNLASTQETVGQMGAELSRVRDEYQAASDDLSS
tara:strand:- start:543 stop:5027 length:4485 start_codon:yes stop_codon:yes gene_type:complete